MKLFWINLGCSISFQKFLFSFVFVQNFWYFPWELSQMIFFLRNFCIMRNLNLLWNLYFVLFTHFWTKWILTAVLAFKQITILLSYFLCLVNWRIKFANIFRFIIWIVIVYILQSQFLNQSLPHLYSFILILKTLYFICLI